VTFFSSLRILGICAIILLIGDILYGGFLHSAFGHGKTRSGWGDVIPHPVLRHASPVDPAEVSFAAPEAILAGVPAKLEFTFQEKKGTPAILSVQHEKLLHVIIIAADMSSFSHVHPEDIGTAEVESGKFSLEYAFPRAGDYIVALDYLHKSARESKRFRTTVGSGIAQAQEPYLYESPHIMGPYSISLETDAIEAGKEAALKYTVQKNGESVTDLVPYLGAAMHVAIVKNDLSEFVHTHGHAHEKVSDESDTPTPAPEGHAVHHPSLPSRFGPFVEAHVVFPTSGMYTVFGEFRHGEEVIATHFTVEVE
jgi:hypothetical protein